MLRKGLRIRFKTREEAKASPGAYLDDDGYVRHRNFACINNGMFRDYAGRWGTVERVVNSDDRIYVVWDGETERDNTWTWEAWMFVCNHNMIDGEEVSEVDK